MLVGYRITRSSYTPSMTDSGESPEVETAMEGTALLSEILRMSVCIFGIVPRGAHDTGDFWGSNYPDEDSDYFKRGVQKYYALRLSKEFSPRNIARINRMLGRLHGR